jgi:hypothetical protein
MDFENISSYFSKIKEGSYLMSKEVVLTSYGTLATAKTKKEDSLKSCCLLQLVQIETPGSYLLENKNKNTKDNSIRIVRDFSIKLIPGIGLFHSKFIKDYLISGHFQKFYKHCLKLFFVFMKLAIFQKMKQLYTFLPHWETGANISVSILYNHSN